MNIETIIGNRPDKCNTVERPPSSNLLIRRDNKSVVASSLPNIWSANHRSLWPRFKNTLDELLELNAHIGFHCEVWEDKQNKNQQYQLEKAYELKGVKFISTPRSDRIGGGVAITLINDSPFALEQINPTNPKKLDVCWGILKLKYPTSKLKSILLCSFYNPPSSRKQAALIDHLSDTYYKYSNSEMGFICAGDRNGIQIDKFLEISDNFRQIVTQPTYNGNKVLDICVTDLGAYYFEPEIRSPVSPNDCKRVPSDHNPWFVRPIKIPMTIAKRESLQSAK